MKKYSKRLKIRERSRFDLEQVVASLPSAKAANRKLTSVLLEDEVVRALKSLADTREISYQNLLRGLILDGLKRVTPVN